MLGTNALAAVGDYIEADNAGKTIRYKVTKDDANGKEVEVTSLASGKYTGEITIPSAVTNNAVTYNVKKIGQYAFYFCEDLTSIIIPGSVTDIGYKAFTHCSSLASITIPSSVTNIENDAFSYCTNLTSITFEENSQLTRIGEEAFEGCSSLTSITIPGSVTSIGEAAFDICSGLESITVEDGNTYYYSKDGENNYNAIIERSTNTLISGCKNTVIPSCVTTIGNWAFAGCRLTSITIPNSVTSIGEHAFLGCTGLTSFNIPSSVTSIGYRAFIEQSDLRSITFWRGVPPSLGKYVFDTSSIVHIYVPAASVDDYKTATNWSEYASIIEAIPSVGDTFTEDNAGKTIRYRITKNDETGQEVEVIVLESGKYTGEITIPSAVTHDAVTYNVTNSGNQAFAGCSGLTSIFIPTSVTGIGGQAFAGCTNLTYVAIPNSVEAIGNFAFNGCEGLCTVAIGSGLTSVGMYAFMGCASVSDVYCYADPSSLSWDDATLDFNMSGETNFHVLSGTDWTYCDVNATFIDDLAPETANTNHIASGTHAGYWTTYYNGTKALQAAVGVHVYKATVEGSAATLGEIGDRIIPAGEAVILKFASPGYLPFTNPETASSSDYADNDLQGVDAPTAKSLYTDAGKTVYTLAGPDGNLGFYRYKGTTLAANKAFLTFDSGSGNLVGFFPFAEDDATSVESPAIRENRNDAPVYDLMGRRVSQPTRGLYIMNGKKVLVK
jgi:hypothetical protein